MARDHTRVNIDIWGDDEFRELPVDAQNLYWMLWTSPSRTYCGAHEWRPGKLTQTAGDWTINRLLSAAAVLSERLFLIVDDATEECLLRSWIKHDGLWKTPNMAVSMAMARAEVASKVIRGVIVHEVKKLVKAEPDLSGWKRAEVVKMLAQLEIDPKTLEPFNPPRNPVANPRFNPPSNPPAKGYGENGVNPPANPPSTTATTTSTDYGYIKSGFVSEASHQGAADDPNQPPPRHCLAHMPDGTNDPCGACGQAKARGREWAEQRRRNAAAARRVELEQIAADRVAEIVDCDLCDDDGYRGMLPCDHVDHTETNAAGRAMVAAALARKAVNE